MIANGLLWGGIPGVILSLSTSDFSISKITNCLNSFIIGTLMITFCINEKHFVNNIEFTESFLRCIFYILYVEFIFYWSHRLQHYNKFLFNSPG